SPINPPSGCAFHPRCPLAVERCHIEVPPSVSMEDGRVVACHVRAPTYAAASKPASQQVPGDVPSAGLVKVLR
ncbi:oligopeptide ABC transporter ATP-binding protein, partial [Mesorhizobium sp. M0136]|uniref:oligopeptide/dipeptide ABC transporter ATP-binding protein n=1 Tax=Mesorhizobium sp. M0136 TaxID=2956890 RepID=UPI00333CF553